MANDRELTITLNVDDAQASAALTSTETKYQALIAALRDVSSSSDQHTQSINSNTGALAENGNVVNKVTQLYRQERMEHREQSFMFREGRDAVMIMTMGLGFLSEGSDNASESTKKLTKSLMEGFMAFQTTNFAIKGVAMALGATVSGGLTAAIAAVVAIGVILMTSMESTTQKLKEERGAVDKLKEGYKNLTAEELKNQLANVNNKIGNYKSPGWMQSDPTGISKSIRGAFGISDDNDLEKLKQQETALKETLRDLGDIENVSNRIRLNQQNLNKLNGDETSPFYYKNIVKSASSLKDAQKTMQQWIEADQQLDKNKEGKSSDKKIKDAEKAEREQERIDDEYNNYVQSGLALELQKEKQNFDKIYQANADNKDRQLILETTYQQKRKAIIGKFQEDINKLLRAANPNPNESQFDATGHILNPNAGISMSEIPNVINESKSNEPGEIKLPDPLQRDKDKKDAEKAWEETHQVVVDSMNIIGSAEDKMFDHFMLSTHKAKDFWDETWQSMENSALQMLNQLIMSSLWNELKKELSTAASGSGSGSSSGSGGLLSGIETLLSYIPGVGSFFSGMSGDLPVPGPMPTLLPDIPAPNINAPSGMPSPSTILSQNITQPLAKLSQTIQNTNSQPVSLSLLNLNKSQANVKSILDRYG
jgi:hypothetical protein